MWTIPVRKVIRKKGETENAVEHKDTLLCSNCKSSDRDSPKPQESMDQGGDFLTAVQSDFANSTGLYWAPTSHAYCWMEGKKTLTYVRHQTQF